MWEDGLSSGTTPLEMSFHYGQNTNTLAVTSMNTMFTFTVNGQQVGIVQNRLLSGGTIGMSVAQLGTEVGVLALARKEG